MFRAVVDLLDGQPAGAVDVAVGPVVEDQREFFGHVPRQVAGCARDRLGCAQPFAVVAVGVFDLGDSSFFRGV